MTAFFTNEHFELLIKWRGQKRDSSNEEQNHAYGELKKAYVITETWAELVKTELFPMGKVDVLKRPTNQGNVFSQYHWARIYPTDESPKELAYTVSIQADYGFVVKVDTIHLKENSQVRREYMSLRGDYDNTSPILGMLPASEGLEKSLPELVQWSIECIRNFNLSYDEVIAKVNLENMTSKEDSEQKKEAVAAQALNRIYYGPPGTGKTYEVSKLLAREYEQKMTSVTKEEWQRQFIADNTASLTWWESAMVALYDLGGKAKVDALLEHPFVKAVTATKSANKNVRNTLWGALQYHTIELSENVKMTKRMAPAVFDKSSDSEWSLAGEWEETCVDLIALVKAYHAGAPATGSVRRYSFVTFHQSYGYEEFVEGLRPVLDDETESSAVRYEIRTGAFKELCQKARLAPHQRFAMVIDEINRGNIAKIFGELITLIEPDKREGSENAISVILPYSSQPFSVPPNVDIIGTMNTADRSLALLDTALRRRFDFVPVLPDTRDETGSPLFGLRVTLAEQVIDIPRMLFVINQRIEALYDRDHCIGHAYFTTLGNVPDGQERLMALSNIFRNRIVPLLEEYFFEDWQKIRLVLADNQKPESDQFVVASQEHEDELDRLFGSDHGLEVYATKQRYSLSGESFNSAEAYIGIYQKFSES